MKDACYVYIKQTRKRGVKNAITMLVKTILYKVNTSLNGT